MRRRKSASLLAAALSASALSFGLLVAVCALAALAATGCDPCPSCTRVPPVPAGAHFVLSGPMTDSRAFPSATLLNTGEVLMAGGKQLAGTLDVAEIFNPANGSFAATTGAMNQARHHHTATLLNDGTVLVAGGDNGGGLLTATAFLSAELFDPASGKFTVTGTMFSPRTWQTATRLADGKVLVAGGSPAVDSTVNSITGTGSGLPVGALPNAELYDPASKQFFGNSGAMNDARTEHTASLIKNCACAKENRVLIAGGVDASGLTLTSAEIFNESDNSFTLTGSMNVARHNHTATTLNDGRVLITGGVNNSFLLLDSAEIYEPKTGVFTMTATPMVAGRAFHSAQLLSDGRVLIAGGRCAIAFLCAFLGQPDGTGDNSAEIFDPATRAFTPTGQMQDIRFEQPAVRLPSGSVLIPGGALLFDTVGELIPGTSLDTAEIFSPASGKFSATAQSMVHSRVGHTATTLNDNRVLIAGGADLTVQIFSTSELYNPATGSFSCIGGTTGRDCTASLHDVRFSQTATPLKNSSQVLIAGGSDGTTTGTPPNEVIIGIGTAEIYNASSRTYTCVGGVSSTPPLCNNSMAEGRYNHVAITLRDGRVLLAGGIDATATVTASAELYDPATGKFTATGSMITAREDFAGALFTSGPLAGQVLVMGGSDATGSFLASAELYNPATGKFTATGSMTDTRFLHIAMLLTSGPNSGRILVAAGSGDQTTELYDPAAETFRAGPDMTQIIFSPFVATIADGRTLFAGGATFNSLGQIAPVAGAELYDPAANRFSTTDSMNNARLFAAGAFLDPASVSGSEAGNVLIAGGQGPNSTLGSSELFVPGSSTTSAAAAAPARSAPALTPKAMQEEVAKVFAAMHQQGTGDALH